MSITDGGRDEASCVVGVERSGPLRSIPRSTPGYDCYAPSALGKAGRFAYKPKINKTVPSRFLCAKIVFK
jgi:hypothetical protein